MDRLNIPLNRLLLSRGSPLLLIISSQNQTVRQSQVWTAASMSVFWAQKERIRWYPGQVKIASHRYQARLNWKRAADMTAIKSNRIIHKSNLVINYSICKTNFWGASHWIMGTLFRVIRLRMKIRQVSLLFCRIRGIWRKLLVMLAAAMPCKIFAFPEIS